MSRRLAVLSVSLILLLLEHEGSGAVNKKADAKPAERFIFWIEGFGNEGDMHIAVLRPGVKAMQRLTDRFSVEQQLGLNGHILAVSPDGKSVAYLAAGTAPPEGGVVTFKAHVRSLDDPKGLGRDLGIAADAVIWSPDGQKLLVSAVEDSVKTTQYLIDLKTKKATKVHLPKFEGPPGAERVRGYYVTDWSRDGKWFLASCSYTEKSGELNIFLNMLKTDGSEVRRLKHVEFGRVGKLSPDGARVLYMGHHTEDAKKLDQLFVARVDGGKPIRVSQELDGSIPFGSYCWSPDGKRVAYVWDNGKQGNDRETFLIAIDADGKNAEVVTSARSMLPIFRGLNWR